MSIFGKKEKQVEMTIGHERQTFVNPETLDIDLSNSEASIEELESSQITVEPKIEAEEKLSFVTPIIEEIKFQPMENKFKNHNSIYFYSLGYQNSRLNIDATESGFLSMSVDDSQLNFGHILDELNEAKQTFIETIEKSFPGLGLLSNDIKVITFSKIIGQR